MRKGDHHQVQRMFRARVLAQGFTLVAIVAGGLYFGAERTKERELWKLQEEEKAEEKRARWIRELEVRDEEEKELRAMMEKRKEKKRVADAREAFRAAEAKRVEAEGGPAKEGAAAAGEGSAWGLWKSGPNTGDSQGDGKEAQPQAKDPKSEPDPSKK